MNYIVKPFTTDKAGKAQSWAVWDTAKKTWSDFLPVQYKFSAEGQAEYLNEVK